MKQCKKFVSTHFDKRYCAFCCQDRLEHNNKYSKLCYYDETLHEGCTYIFNIKLAISVTELTEIINNYDVRSVIEK